MRKQFSSLIAVFVIVWSIPGLAEPDTAPVPDPEPAPAPEVAMPKPAESSPAANPEAAAVEEVVQDKRTAEADLAAVQAGKLLQYGITGGFAFAIQTPFWFSRSKAEQETFTPAAIPYVLLVPGYWFSPSPERKAYCAAEWSGTSAWDAVVPLAQDSAAHKFEAVQAAVRAQQKSSGRQELTAEERNQIAKKAFIYEAESEVDAVERGSIVVDLAQKGDRQSAIDYLIHEFYSPDFYDEPCIFSYKFGVWVGLPPDYKVTTTLRELNGLDVRMKREVDAIVSAGLAFVPNAYISVLLGVTIGNLTQADTATASGTEQLMVAGTVAFGGNLDILTMLTK